MSREYDQLAWVDFPERLTPLSAANLNRMENGIANLYTDRNKMENNIAYVEEGEEATRHYFINSYLMLNGIFYKTVSEINVGDLLDYGLDGNIEHVDISSQFGSGGGGSTGCVELTQAQYDALSDEAKMLDVIYLITDSPDNYLDEVFGDFATVEYTDAASKAYAVGDYLVYDSKFYRVTSAIAQGDTITPGTNVEQTSVGEEVNKKVSKSGGSLNGPLRYITSDLGIDASKADNNLSTTLWPTISSINDSEDRIMARFESMIEPNGNIGAQMYCRNYNTSGEQVAQKGIRLTMNKAGNLTYGIDDAANFRSAIGVRTLTPRYVQVTVPANTSHVNVTASIPTGSTFLCWFQVVTDGFVSGAYVVGATNPNSTVWIQSPPGSQQTVTCWYFTQS